MASAWLVIGLVFVGIGAWLLLWRFLHICYVGEFWNNMPLVLSWGETIIILGMTVSFVGVVWTFETCEFDCERQGSKPMEFVWTGLIIGVAGVIVWLNPCCKRDKKKTPIFYDWETNEDNRGAKSGVDFVALAIGLGILTVAGNIGKCPQSCAQAVLVR